MKKVITKSNPNVVDVQEVNNEKIYIMSVNGRMAILTSANYHDEKYKWVILDSSFTRANCYEVKSPLEFKEAIRYQIEVNNREVHQFDTMKEAMLFVFGDN
jgi:hypothetical protein